MKKSIMAMVVGLGLLLAGCSQQPSHVGTWKGQPEPGENVILTLTEDGGMVFEEEGGESFKGSWKTTDDGIIELTADGEDDKAIVTLSNDNELVFSVDDHSITFTRQD